MNAKKALSMLLMMVLIISCAVVFPTKVEAADLSTWQQFITEFENMRTTGGTITLTSNIMSPNGTDLVLEASQPVTINTGIYTIGIASNDITAPTNITFAQGVTITHNGQYTAGINIGTHATVTINGSTIIKTEMGGAVKVSAHGRLTLMAGSVNATHVGIDVEDYGIATIQGGTITTIAIGSVGVIVRERGELLMRGNTSVIEASGNGSRGLSSYGVVTLEDTPIIKAHGAGSGGIHIHTTGTAVIESALIEGERTGISCFGKITIEGGEINSTGSITGFGVSTAYDGEVIINGGTITTNGIGSKAVYAEQGGMVTINGGEINAAGNSGLGIAVDGEGSSVYFNGGKITSTYQGIEAFNGSKVNMSGGSIQAWYHGIYANDRSLINVSGGTITTTSIQGVGIYITGLSNAHISGDANITGGFSNGSGIQVDLGGEANISGGKIAGANGIYTYDEVNIDGGVIEGKNGSGIRIENMGVVNVTDGDISGTICGIMVGNDGALNVSNGVIRGINYGISGSGIISIYNGIINGRDNGISLGSEGFAILYNGRIEATGQENAYSIYTQGDPSLTIYSAVTLNGDKYLGTEAPENYAELDSFIMVSPQAVELILGENKSVDFEVQGQKLNGDTIMLQDQIGPFGFLANAAYTASGNTVTFTPTGVGNATLSINDNITYNGQSHIAINVAIRESNLIITTENMKVGQVGQSYSQLLTASGGLGPYTWSVANLPEGLTIDTAKGEVHGTPSVSGDFIPVFTVKDINGASIGQSINLVIEESEVTTELVITTANMPVGQVGKMYNQLVTASSGLEPYIWSAAGLPNGLSINTATGLVYGMPKVWGDFNVAFTVSDITSTSISREIIISIKQEEKNAESGGGGGSSIASIAISKISILEGTEGTNYTYTLTASGGRSPYVFTVTGGELPTGLILEKNGDLYGMPTGAGIYEYTVAVTDQDGKSSSHTFIQVIKKAATETKGVSKREIILTSGSLYALVDGQPYQMDAAPFIDNEASRVMVPIRFISEALGGKTGWNSKTREIRIKDGTKEIILVVGSRDVIINGEMTTIDCAPVIVTPGRTFVPIRVISEALGAVVEYDSQTRQIKITRYY